MLNFFNIFPEIENNLNKYKVHMAIGKNVKREP